MDKSFKRNIKKEFEGVKYDEDQSVEVFCNIRNTMLNEGNNCVYLSKYIKNVAVRWNKDIHILKFTGHWGKRETAATMRSKLTDVMSEVIIETKVGGEAIILKVEISKEQLKYLMNFEDSKQEYLTATERPVICF